MKLEGYVCWIVVFDCNVLELSLLLCFLIAKTDDF